MILRMTVRDADTGATHDIEVSAAPATSVRSLLAALPIPATGRRCFAGAVALDPAARLADTPLLAGSVLSVGGPGPAGRLVTDGAVGVLEVVAGPDAGLAVALRPGTHPIARTSSAALPLRDADVSRRTHALLEVSADGTATLTDGGSSNGTFVDGARITHPTAVASASALQIGGNEVRWTPLPAEARRTVRAADGRVDFDRAFARAPVIGVVEVSMPVRPIVARGPVAAGILLGGAGSVATALFTHTPILLLGAAISVGALLLNQSAQEKQDAERQAEFTKAKKAVESAVAAQVEAEQRVRRTLAPSPAEIVEIAGGVRSGLWTRRAGAPHALALRVGVADEPASVTVRGEPWPEFRTPKLSAVPITVDLGVVGVLGVTGADEAVHDVLRWLLLQLATLRAPDDLRMVLLSAAEVGGLTWARWLPHIDAGDAAAYSCRIGNTAGTRTERVRELRTLVASRRAERDPQRFVDVVVVLDGALALRDLPGMDEVLRDGPAVGVYLICADRHSMNECRGLIETSGDSTRLTASPDGQAVTVDADGVDATTAERLARALAPMRDRATRGAAQNAIPRSVRLLDLLDLGTPTAADVLALWERGRGPRTRVLLGADATGPVAVDLAGQGPHTMLGGATGAGKSILLQTLVTSLLLANRPDELNLVLVDFKGGSAFLPFEHCPHVVALIRSTGETPADVFDDAAAARVLASLRAEVSRRESLLARHDGEIDRYWQKRLGGTALPPLPRLVLIFDEFGRVLDASPDFVRELVNVAAKGRSLGMHLVLATQSLQGKLSPELKNNVSLRISLRQNEPADSTEVLGVPDAASIPGVLRGRGMILCTTAESRVPQPFQSGYLGDPPPAGGATPALVRVLSATDLGAARPTAAPRAGSGPTDQELAIAAIEEAAQRSGLPAPFRPVLPPLPATLTVDELPAQWTAAAPRTAVPFGLADDPARQAQPADFLDLAGADRLLVAGGPQSGRTTFARTLITGLVGRFRPDQAHLYVVERHPAGLAEYAGLPHCGGVFSPAEPDRIRRLVTWLDEEIQRRAGSASPPDTARPYIVVVIDGWEHFEDHGDPTFVETSLVATLRGVISAGTPLGVHVVPIGGQDMLTHRLPTLYNRRLLLPFPKEETRRMQLLTSMTSPPVLPGRAIDAGSGRHVQMCLPTRSVADLAAEPHDTPAHRRPRRFPALPSRVDLAALDTTAAGQGRSTWIPLGVGGPDTTTIGVDLFEAGPHLMLISGTGGTGRTTAAAAVVHALRRRGIGVLAVAPPQSPLPGLLSDDPGLRVVTGVAIRDTDLREAVAAFGDMPYAVVVDDVDRITVLPTEQGFASSPTLLDDIVQPAARGRRALIVSADAAPLLTGFPSPLTRLVNAVMLAGTRLVLAPSNRTTAVAHNITLEPDQYLTGPPGRGYLSTGRTPVLVQVAAP
ncbi:FtsK/SpoIIIE domain-containing protein [Micromonospora sp. MH99]|uniref:FtsK/SpoIIIE domain-containing protein n=1 Tax=Micromonospora sp. MH99 TaxID=1945510 RepID=UPI001F2A9A52|nr:FtsK/SpoIIIE domain-containing protein [Micromonospora sp. MH99]MCF0092893.1 ESX-3 secretion system protein EccC3 [Micromonospora sp. MH99]